MSTIPSPLIRLLVVICVVVGATAGVIAGSDTVALKGKFAGVGSDFSGTFSHLGRFTGVVTGTLEDPGAEWTAADGDMVTTQTTLFVIDFANPIGPTEFPYTQTIAIVGGTGRFAGATGSVSVTGTIDLVDLSYDGIIDGTISRPNSGG